MSEHRVTFIIGAIVCVCVLGILMNQSWRWIAFNGWSASSYAKKMLSGDLTQNERFIDYIVYSSNGCVVFAEHESEDHRMIYCPKDLPIDSVGLGKLSHVVGSWYRGRTD
jgi:hypothetical protein